MKPRILFLASSSQEHPAAGGRTRIVSEIRYGLAGDYEIVLLCMVRPSKLRNRQFYKARESLQNITNSRVIYCPALPSFGTAWLHWVSRRLQAWSTAFIASRFSVCGIHAHGLSAACVAQMARRNGFGGWVLFDVHGASPEEYLHATQRPDRNWLTKLEADEKSVLQDADQVFFVSRQMQHFYASKYGISPKRSAVVPCATSARVNLDPQLRSELRTKLGVQSNLVFVYSGSWRKYQMVQETVTFFSEIRKRIANAFFLILTGQVEEFRRSVQAQGLNPADYTIMSLPHDEVFQVLQAADVGFLLRDDSVVNRVASPTKFAEYCICGLPVLLTRYVGDYSGEAEEHQLGFVLEQLEFTDALGCFLKDVQNRREVYAMRCHKYARTCLTWQQAGRTLRGAYERLLRGEQASQPALGS